MPSPGAQGWGLKDTGTSKFDCQFTCLIPCICPAALLWLNSDDYIRAAAAPLFSCTTPIHT